MIEKKNYRNTDMWQKTDELVSKIVSFSESLPKDDLRDIRKRLRTSADMVAPALEEGFRKRNKVDKIRQWIKANGMLEECKDYLLLVKTLKYGQTDELVKHVEEVSELLKENYNTVVSN